MKKGEKAADEFKAAAVDAVDDLLGGGEITRHQAFALVAQNVGVHPHTVRNWWRAAHPELLLTAQDRASLVALEEKVAALTRLNERLSALGRRASVG